MSSLGWLLDPAPDVTPLTPHSSPAPPASPPLALYLYLTGVCSPSQVYTQTHSHTQISGTNGPRVLRDPCPGSLQVSAPRVPLSLTKPPAASFKLGAPALGLSRALFLSLFLSFSLF